ncbi:MAG: RNA polymerase subunit sigma-24 [Flavobacteriales bacterium]|nr:MAG: RNA polymerase subunit sigma-24 [Flavobacteriales bacterium]
MTVAEYNESVDQYSDNLYRFIIKNIKDEDKAKDIVQDTYLKFWEKKDNVDLTKIKSYLFTTAYHTLIDVVRKEKKQGSFNDVKEESYSTNSEYSDLQEILHEAVEQLPEDQKAVILLRDYEGYAYHEIAEITGMTESQVKVYIFRGRKFLKNYLGSIEALI